MKEVSVIRTHALIFAGLVPSAPPTIEMLLILTSDVNLYKHSPKLVEANSSKTGRASQKQPE